MFEITKAEQQEIKLMLELLACLNEQLADQNMTKY